VVVEFGTGGVCGSDLPKYVHATSHSDRDIGGPGWPLHELVGTVLASAHDQFRLGDRVVGAVPGAIGLVERCTVPAHVLVTIPDGIASAQAVMIQPLATVLYAVDKLGAVAGRTAAVLGLGPIGLLFAAVLADRGAVVTGVDPVDRSAVAERFGVSTLIAERAKDWAVGLTDADRPELCVEAVGHQTSTLPAALEAVATDGAVYAFGVPDDETYALPFRAFFDKHATLYTGTTRNWPGAMAAAARHLTAHPELVDGYITHRFTLDDVTAAYETALRHEPGRLKVVIDA